MDLFETGDFTFHSGLKSQFKIECDSLSIGSWKTLAAMAAEILEPFSSVTYIPRGGYLFAKELEQYKTDHGSILLVDDVFTTGESMNQRRLPYPKMIGVVAFAWAPTPFWITPVVKMNPSILGLF